MISLSEDSAKVLQEKALVGATLRLLLLDPDWAERHSDVLTFLPGDHRHAFHLEIRNSLAKLGQLHRTLPEEAKSRLRVKGYSTIFPYIVTGYENGREGRCVVEINDHLSERNRPRFSVEGQSPLFSIIIEKYKSLWSSGLARDLLS